MRKNSYGEVVRSGRISETDYEIAEVRDALGRVGYHVSLTHKDAHKFLDAGFKSLGRHGFGVNGTIDDCMVFINGAIVRFEGFVTQKLRGQTTL